MRKNLVSHETYFSTPEVESGWADIRMVNDQNSIHQEKYHIIKMETYNDQNAKRYGGGANVSSQRSPHLQYRK